MHIKDAHWIPKPQHQVWEALTDPTVLQKCIPGCARMEQRSPTEYWVTLHSKACGIEAEYEGELLLSDIQAPDSCTLAFEGKGRAAGLVIGTAQVNLTTKDDGTRLAYTVAGMAGGKLAQVGEPMLVKAGNKIVDSFMSAFMDHITRVPTTAPPAPPIVAEDGMRNPMFTWAIPALVVVLLVGYHTLFR